MTILVCGGRDFTDQAKVNDVLDGIHAATGIEQLVHGAARGADTCAANWADKRLVTHIAYPADWTKHGKAAGVIRNQQMLDSETIDLVVAFPGGRGTEDMIRRSHRAGLEVMIVEPNAV